MAAIKSKVILFGEKIYEWLSQFATTYRNVLPAGVEPEETYILIDGISDYFSMPTTFPVNIYKRKTTSPRSVLLVADAIGDAVGESGLLLVDDDIKIAIYKGSPFYQDRTLENDETTKAGMVNLNITVY